MLPMPVVGRLASQMYQALAWLHHNSCVHRDIKGDNFMMSSEAVEDPSNRIYLADFETVFQLRPGQRLSCKCGTELYWAPEFYEGDYGLKVDCCCRRAHIRHVLWQVSLQERGGGPIQRARPW